MSSWKLETDLDAADLPRFLRALADALESGAPQSGELAGLPASGRGGELRKLVLVADADGVGQGFTLKLKAKRSHELRVPTQKHAGGKVSSPAATLRAPAPAKAQGDPKAADAAARGREKYRQLKKALQADYKALRKAAEEGRMPAQDVVESFLALGESMAESAQPLKGAGGPEVAEIRQANAAYLEDARALRRAVSARDAAALSEVLARLERRKSACHAQFR